MNVCMRLLAVFSVLSFVFIEDKSLFVEEIESDYVRLTYEVLYLKLLVKPELPFECPLSPTYIQFKIIFFYDLTVGH